ncbi:MAG: type II toxin-antitoxin system prevent-host-death family antitoxin [Gemmatimonadota bacterium]
MKEDEMAGPKKTIEVSASDLKNAWHEFLSQVSQGRQEVVVTRYGHPIARLTPYGGPEESGGIFGYLAGSVTVHGDIIGPIEEAWDADA